MADKVITIKVDGDTKGLERAVDKADHDLDRLGKAAKDTADGMGGHASGIGTKFDDLDKSSRSMADGAEGSFNRVGNKFDDLDMSSRSMADGAEGSFNRITGSAKTMYTALAGVVAGGAIIGIGAQLNSLGLELDILDKKTTTVFEGSADNVRKWADANNEAMGMSDEKLSGLAAGFGDLLKPMGFTAEQAATMSTEVVGLAGALSAWSGGTIKAAEVSDILAKAMLGEADGLKALGISISAAEVEAKALSMGLVATEVDLLKVETATLAAEKAQRKTAEATAKYGEASVEASVAVREQAIAENKLAAEIAGSAGDVDAQSAAIATQALIFEKSTDAQKAWADGSMDAIKSQNSLRATIDDLKASLAEKLQPAFQAVFGWLQSDGIPAVMAFGATFRDDVFPVIQNVAGWIADTLGPTLADLGDAITSRVVPAVKGFAGWVEDTLWPALVKLGGQINTHVLPAVVSFGRFLRDDVVPAVDSLGRWVRDTLIPALGTFGKWVTDNAPIMTGLFAGLAFVVGVSLINSVLAVIPVIIAWAAAQWAAAAAVIATNLPLIAITAAIAALVAGVVYAYQNWDWFRIAVDAVASFLTDTLWPAIKTVAEWLWDRLGPAVSAVAGFFTDTLIPAISTIVGWLWDRLVPAIQGQIDILQTLWDKAGPVFGFIRDAIGWVIDRNVELAKGFADLATTIADKVGPIKDVIVAPFRAAFNAIADAWNNTVGALSFQIPGWVPTLGGNGFDMPNIPKMAIGGPASGLIRVGERGPENLVVPRGSRIEPNHAMAGGGGVTVYAQTNANPWDIAREVEWVMRTAGR